MLLLLQNMSTRSWPSRSSLSNKWPSKPSLISSDVKSHRATHYETLNANKYYITRYAVVSAGQNRQPTAKHVDNLPTHVSSTTSRHTYVYTAPHLHRQVNAAAAFVQTDPRIAAREKQRVILRHLRHAGAHQSHVTLKTSPHQQATQDGSKRSSVQLPQLPP